MPKEVPSDEYLIKEALSGKDEAFTELLRRHKQVVLNIIARHIRNHYELDDLCQETFIMVYQNLGKYRGDEPFEHWMSTMAVNACCNVFREKQCEPGDSVFKDIPDNED